MAEHAARLDEVGRQIEDARRPPLAGDDGSAHPPVLASFMSVAKDFR